MTALRPHLGHRVPPSDGPKADNAANLPGRMVAPTAVINLSSLLRPASTLQCINDRRESAKATATGVIQFVSCERLALVLEQRYWHAALDLPADQACRRVGRTQIERAVTIIPTLLNIRAAFTATIHTYPRRPLQLLPADTVLVELTCNDA